jgi:hypothetical protein
MTFGGATSAPLRLVSSVRSVSPHSNILDPSPNAVQRHEHQGFGEPRVMMLTTAPNWRMTGHFVPAWVPTSPCAIAIQ